MKVKYKKGTTVRPIFLVAIALVVGFFLVNSGLLSQIINKGNVEGTSTGFNEFGYNETARLFNGKADGVDRILDGKVWGDPRYANDHLVMKWNADWDRGNDESWSKPPYNAWTDNEWNGKVKGGSGEMWHYKIVWVGNYTADPSLIPAGGYGIWGQFAVILSQGTFGNQHIWDVLANPAGYGAY